MDKDIIISIKTVLFIFLLLFGVYIVYAIRPILIILVVATLIVISMEHAVNFFKNQRVMNRPLPRSAAVILAYSLLILFIAGILTIGLPPVVTQAQKLLGKIAMVIKEIPGMENTDFSLANLLPNLSGVSQNIFSTTFSFLESIAGIFSILIIAIYMSIDWENIKARLLGLFTGDLKHEIKDTLEEVEVSIGHWVKGQILLMLVIGAISFVGLVVLGVDYPLALSLIAGLLEIVPVLGPVIALVLAGVVGFSDSVTQGVAVIALFTLIQQIENNFLVPKVMHRVSGFSPLVILIALLVGSTLFGVVGAILAVPITMILVIVIKRVITHSPQLEI